MNIADCKLPPKWTQAVQWMQNSPDSGIVIRVFTSTYQTVSGQAYLDRQHCEGENTNNQTDSFFVIFYQRADSLRYCLELHVTGNAMLYRESKPENRSVPYTVTECIRILGRRTSLTILARSPMNNQTIPMPFPLGVYKTTYGPRGDKLNQCEGDVMSKTIIQPDALIMSSCFNKTSSYAAPFIGNFTILALVNDSIFNQPDTMYPTQQPLSGYSIQTTPTQSLQTQKEFTQTTATQWDPFDNDKEQKILLLGYREKPEERLRLYCARYTIEGTAILLSIDVNSSRPGMCEDNMTDNRKKDGYVTVTLKPMQCSTAPCYNNGTCTETFSGYLCTCPPAFKGNRCNTSRCSLPANWRSFGAWWTGYHGQNQNSATVQFSEYKMMHARAKEESWVCEGQEKTTSGSTMLTLGSEDGLYRHCMEGHQLDNIFLYRKSEELKKQVVNVSACYSILGPRKMMQVWLKTPFDLATNQTVFPKGIYHTSYVDGSTGNEYCMNDNTSQSNIDGNSIYIKSCFRGFPSRSKPFFTVLTVVAHFSGSLLDLTVDINNITTNDYLSKPPNGDILVLANRNTSSGITSFYCARYTVRKNVIWLSLYVNSTSQVMCEVNRTYSYASDGYVLIKLSSELCSRETPCLNGATCEDGLVEYTCHCPVGFTGRHCETDIDHCKHNRCANGARCVDGTANYTCICPDKDVWGPLCEESICKFPGTWRSPLLWWRHYSSLTGEPVVRQITQNKILTVRGKDVVASVTCRDLQPFVPLYYFKWTAENKTSPQRCAEFFGTENILTEKLGKDLDPSYNDVPASMCLTFLSAESKERARVMVKYPFDFSKTVCPLPQGIFATTIARTTQEGILCQGDKTSQVTITGNQFIIDTCYTGPIDYENPFKTTLTCVDGFNSRVGGFVGVSQNLLILATTNNTAGRTYFYCAKYYHDHEHFTIQVSVDVSRMNNLMCTSKSTFMTYGTDEDGTLHRAFNLSYTLCTRDPCFNGATCTDLLGDYACSCMSGFTGRNCETNIDDCPGHTCLNGATCLDEVNNYRCQCSEAFWGVKCEREVCIFPNKWISDKKWFTRYIPPNNTIELLQIHNGSMSRINQNEYWQCERYSKGPEPMILALVREEVNFVGRICFDGILENGVLYYRLSRVVRTNRTFTIPDCERVLGNRTIMYAMFSYPFNLTPQGEVPFQEGKYQMTYSINGSDAKNCDGDLKSEATVRGNLIIIVSCFTGTPSYDRPFNTTFKFLGKYTGSQAGGAAGQGSDRAMLAYTDLNGGREIFTCATYGSRNNTFYLSVNVISTSLPQCDSSGNSDQFGENNIRFEFKSSACHFERPCLHGATCLDVLADYKCVCTPAYTGRLCETDIDDCVADKCENGAKCVDQLNNYTCTCLPGFTGTYCSQRTCVFPAVWRLPQSWWFGYENGTGSTLLQEFGDGKVVVRSVGSSTDKQTHDCVEIQQALPLHHYVRYPSRRAGEQVCMEVFTTRQLITEKTGVVATGGAAAPISSCPAAVASSKMIRILVKYPFQFKTTSCPFAMGTYQVTYRRSAIQSSLCSKDAFSEAVIKGNNFTMNLCNTDTLVSQIPSSFTCVEYLSAAGANVGGKGEIVILAHHDSSSDRYIFYCARYRFSASRNTIYLSLTIRKGDQLWCEADQTFTSVGETAEGEHIAFILKPNNCMKDPCMNNGTCLQTFTSYTCTCGTGFTGFNCETDIDDCVGNRCTNGATCVDKVNSYICKCPKGYWGTYCEFARCEYHEDWIFKVWTGGYNIGSTDTIEFAKHELTGVGGNETGKQTCVAERRADKSRIFSIFAVKQSSNKHYCLEAWAQNQVMLMRTTPPVTRSMPYTISECTSTLGTRDKLKVLINDPGNRAATVLPFTEGSYQTEYTEPGMVPRCVGNTTSVTTVLGPYFDIISCYQGNTSYERPLRTKLRALSWIKESSITSVGSGGGDFLILMYIHPGTSQRRFYCARFKVIGKTIYMSLHTETPQRALCDTTKDYKYLSAGYITLKLIYINFCDGGPCSNGGTCINLLYGYRCICAKHFTGPQCQFDNECESDPCQNGAICVDGFSRYSCICAVGYTGTRCQIDVDECASNPCKHNGTCLDRVNGYYCSCRKSYIGPNCEATSPCMSNPCQNGGTCYDREWTRFQCSCKDGFMGAFCDKVPKVATKTSFFGELTWPSLGLVLIVLLVVVLVSVTIVALLICLVKKTPLPDKAFVTEEGHADEEGATGKTESDEDLSKKGNAWYPSYKSTKL